METTKAQDDAKRVAILGDALRELLDALQEFSDIEDGRFGPKPNREMRWASLIEQALKDAGVE
jgi:hypothetical protein